METVRKYYRVDRRQISFLKFIIEAYDGAALVRTIDPSSGTVALHIAPGCESVVETVLSDLKNEILFEVLDGASNPEAQ